MMYVPSDDEAIEAAEPSEKNGKLSRALSDGEIQALTF